MQWPTTETEFSMALLLLFHCSEVLFEGNDNNNGDDVFTFF